MKNSTVTLLTWSSENHDPEVIKNVLKDLKKANKIVNKVYYLYQPFQEKKLGEIKQTCTCLEPICIDLNKPTDHRKIYDEIRNKVLPFVAELQNLFINISPGTPAMHAVWLILYAAGEFRPGTQLISSQWNPKTKETFCDDVDFPITTYLSELRKYEKENPNEPYYEPEAKSKARQLALEKVRVYASIQGVPMLLLGERGIGKSRLVESYIA